MMKIKKILTGLCLVISTQSFANYGLIQDKDGYVNVRDQASLSSKVSAKLNNDEVVSCSFDQGDASFCYALYDVNGHINSGFIYKSRVNFFQGFKKWKFMKSVSNEAMYNDGKNQIFIVARSPQLSNRDFKKSAQSYTHYKKKPFFGTDGELPSQDGMYQLGEIKVTYNDKTTIIPKQNLEQYFFPNKPLAKGDLKDHEMSEIYSKGKDLYIFNRLSNGGAAQYTLFLHIRDGKLIKQSAWSESL